MESLLTDDQLRLQLRHWSLPRARGTVLIVHGLGEHCGRHAALAADLNAAGWSAVGYDQRGHGESAGARGALPASDRLLRDLAQLIDHCRSREAPPLVLLGHSLGGLIAARFVAEALAMAPATWSRSVEGLVLSSPALATEMTAMQRLLLAILGPLAPSLAVNNGLNPDWLSRDPAVVRAYRADPLNHERITPRLARFIVEAGDFVRHCASRWQTPTLLLYAGADRCVAPAGSRAFADSAPRTTVTAHEFPALYHEIFNEPERADVVALLRAWLFDRSPS